MLHQPGKELTVMQGQFLLQRVPPVGGVLIVTVTERDVLVFHRRDFIFAQARSFGIPPDYIVSPVRAFPEAAPDEQSTASCLPRV